MSNNADSKIGGDPRSGSGSSAFGPRFFGRRKGPGLSDRRQGLLDRLLPALTLSLDALPGTSGAESRNWQAIFGRPVRGLWMEIGFGKGEHLADLAGAHPDIGFIGCEPYLNGVAALLDRIDAEGLTNIRLYADDARLLMGALPDGCLERLFLIQPDPWPKKRHAERRFVGSENLDAISRLLVDGGLFRCGTDHPVYREWALVQMSARTDFEWTAERPEDWRVRPDDWPATRYEQKALEGKSVYLTWRRRARGL